MPLYTELRDLPADDTVVGTGTASILVQVFFDGNRDAQMNSNERGLEGAKVELIQVREDGDRIVATDVSAGDAIVRFAELPAGEYRLRVTLPDEVIFTDKSAKKMTLKQNWMQQSALRTEESDPIPVADGEEVGTAVGAMQPGALSGRVWFDQDGDGEREETESGMNGVLMELESQRSGEIYQTVTDENGDYRFERIKPGDYYLRCYLPDGMMFTVYNNRVNVKLRTVIYGEGRSTGRRDVTISRDQALTDQNIGVVSGASVSVVCYEDLNDNGVFDEGEPALPGVMFKLSRQNGNELSTVYSEDSGKASFGALRTGTYKVMARLPEGWNYSPLGTGDTGNRFYQDNRRDCTLNNVTLTDAGQSIVLYLDGQQLVRNHRCQ